MLYFEYNYLESEIPIYNNQQMVIGEIELHEFQSSVTFFEHSQEKRYRGEILMHEKNKYFTVITNTWEVFNQDDIVIGKLKERFLSWRRRYDYTVNDEFKYSFIGKLFTKNYIVIDKKRTLIANVYRKFGWVQNKIIVHCHTGQVDLLELITALTGVFILNRQKDK